MKFRPCIDLHNGVVKQIVGSSLKDGDETPETNFSSNKPSRWYAELYKQDQLRGGHVIQLGPNNENAATEALQAWPGGLQIGGGINIDNAELWIEKGASGVIVTSWVFQNGIINMKRIKELSARIGRENLILDLSCRKRGEDYWVVTDRWQTFTDEKISLPLLDELSRFAGEFLIHAVDVEGMCQGIEEELVSLLGKWSGIPVTYAGGIQSIEDIHKIEYSGNNNIDFTVGSALDIFGGSQLKYRELAQKYSDVNTEKRQS